MLRRWFEAVITSPPSWLLPLLLPLTLLYAGGIALHRFLYRIGILKPGKLPRPVVSVGNLTAGGGGKTPVVMWLAEMILKAGVRPAILSRGYGRKGIGIQIVDPEGPWSSFGDEPSMMANRLEDVPVVVGADRRLAGLELLKHQEVDLFILDDGFQHLALQKDLNLIVVDSNKRFGNGRLLPAGILREPVSRLKDADYIIVTRAKQVDTEFEQYLKGYSKAPVLWADYKPLGLFNIDTKCHILEEKIPKGPFVAFCGVAGPEGFRISLAKAGIEVAQLLTFPDHHPYSSADVDRINTAALRNQACALVTTEKDAVRWPWGKVSLPVYSLAVWPEIDEAGEVVGKVLKLIQRHRENT